MQSASQTMTETTDPNPDSSELQSMRNSLRENSLPMNCLVLLDYILRSRQLLFEQISRNKDLGRLVFILSTISFFSTMSYGITMGFHGGGMQALSSALKLPALFLLTAFSCTPSLYVVSILMNQKHRFLQVLCVQSLAIATTSILLLSLTPIQLILQTSLQSYSFAVLLHVTTLGISGWFGISYLKEAMVTLNQGVIDLASQRLLMVWIGFYALIGSQLGWILRPFIGSGDTFQWFRQLEGDFFSSVFAVFLIFIGF